MSPFDQLTFPLRVALAQQGKRQREESEGEPQAKRVQCESSQVQSTQQIDLASSHVNNNGDNDEIVENVIRVLVENEKHQFFVRQDKICESSKLFRAMVSSSTGPESFVSLPTTTSDEFRTYLYWLKTRDVSLQVWFNRTGQSLLITQPEELQAYMDIYVLAENLDDRKLRNHVMKIFIHNCPELSAIPDEEWCARIWEQTSEGSRLRSFVVEWLFFRYGGFVRSARFEREAWEYPEEARKMFLQVAVERGLPAGGSRPNKVARDAFQEAMHGKLLERRSR